MSFLHKVSIRNIVRYKKRLFMMLLGVGGCTALIVAGLGLRDSISTVVDDQFRGVTHYQIAVTFVSPMDEAQQQAFCEKYADEMTQCIFVHAAAYEAHTSSGINKVNVIATDDPAITQAIDLHENGRTVAWPQQGVLLDAALARDTGVSVGETAPGLRGRHDERRSPRRRDVRELCLPLCLHDGGDLQGPVRRRLRI